MDNFKKKVYIPLTIKINDAATIRGKFMIDTGSPESTLTSSVAKINNLDKNIKRKVRYYTKYGGIGGESSGYEFIADSLQISDYCLANVNMSYSEDSLGLLASEEYVGILGNNILERFNLIFDFRNIRFNLSPLPF